MEMKSVDNSKFQKPKSVAEYIAMQINLCGKSQHEIAQEADFPKPNMITMIKQGKSKLPTAKIGKFAKAIGVDPMHLFKLCMSEYMPDTWEAIEDIIKQPVLTNNELEIIAAIRQSNQVSNPKLNTPEDYERLTAFLETLKGDNR
jgi:hypothetical protein